MEAELDRCLLRLMSAACKGTIPIYQVLTNQCEVPMYEPCSAPINIVTSHITGDKLAKALELASLLSLHKSMEGAVKLVSAARLPALAERMNQLLEVRISPTAEASNCTCSSAHEFKLFYISRLTLN